MKINFVSKLVVISFSIFLAGCAAFESHTPAIKGAVATVPTVTLNAPADGTHVSDSHITVNGTCTTDAGTVTISGSALSSDIATACASDVFSTSAALAPTEGEKTLTISQSTAAGTATKTISMTRNCAENYILIPADTTIGTPAFCMAKFEMKVKTNAGAAIFDGYNGGVPLDVSLYKPDSRPDGVPWVRITQADAILECASLGTGYHLITTREWNAMARNAEGVAANWESGVVGSGQMFRGNSDGVISASAIADGYSSAGTSLLAASSELDPYVGTGNAATDTFGAGKEQRRTFELSNGATIWDAAGNARDFNDVDGFGSTISYTGPGSSGLNDVFSPAATSFLSSIVISGGGVFNPNWLLPATAGLSNTTNFIGRFYISSNARTGRIISRGANFDSINSPGLFAADFDTGNSMTSSSASFRCAKSL